MSYKNLAKELRAGDTILVNNGLVSFRVLSVEGTEIRCQAIIGGDLSDHKSMSFPNKVLKQPYLSEQDKKDLLLGIENGVDFIAASFVSCQQDILDLKAFLSAHGGGTIDIIAKIENRAGVDNIESICDVCEGIMVARGDLGVELPYEKLPALQKLLIRKSGAQGRFAITATEMLESMITKLRPTRAEIVDVANAVYDGSSCVMLSAESAVGINPPNVITTMAKIAVEAENNIDYHKIHATTDFTQLSDDTISMRRSTPLSKSTRKPSSYSRRAALLQP